MAMARRTPRRFCFTLDLPVRNEWGNIEKLRESVHSCLSAMFNDMDGCHAITMITGELLENAMKYGLSTSLGLRSVLRPCQR